MARYAARLVSGSAVAPRARRIQARFPGNRRLGRRGLGLVIVAGSGLLSVGCGGGDNRVEHYRVPRDEPAAAAAPAARPEVAPSGGGSLVWTAPAGWESRPASSMRLASFAVPTDGDPADCSIIVLGGGGGGLAANVNRWRGQVGLPVLPEAEVVATGKTASGALGAFQTFQIVNPAAPDLAFLVAVLPFGERTVFVKLQTAAQNLSSLESAFLAFCQSLKSAPE